MSTTPRNALATLAVAVATAALTVVPVTGASAADTGPSSAAVSGVEVHGRQVSFVLTVKDLPDSGTVKAGSVRVSMDGRPVDAVATRIGASPGTTGTQVPRPGARTREAILVLDASGSMRGSRIAAAKAAAARYARVLPADVSVGLVTFADRPRKVLAPTADRAALRSALSRVRARGNTALYDAVQVAQSAFGKKSGQRRMLILSDGEDTSSRRGLADATRSLSGTGTGVDAVGMDVTGGQVAVLKKLAAAGSGRLLRTSGLDQLSSAFVEAARTFSEQVTVTADIPSELAGQAVTLSATLQAGGESLKAASRVQLGAAPAGAASPPTPSPQAVAVAAPPLTVMALAFAALLGLGLLLVWRPRPARDGQGRIDQLDAYQWSEPNASGTIAPAEGQVAGFALSVAEKLIRSRSSRSRIAADLERAGMRIRPQEWIILRVSASSALIAVITVLTRSLIVGVLLGSLLGWLGTRVYVQVKARRRSAEFADQLPDALQLIASSLRSGFSLPQALDGVVREGSEPIASEFGRALAESRLGVRLEDALESGADRMRSQDLAWVVMAVRISRDVGGNLAEVLLNTVHTMRERAQLARQVRALSAEGRLSAYVLIGLPLVVTGWFSLVKPEYLRPLYTSAAGIVMLVVAALGMVVGSFWMSRVVKVEV